MKNSIKVYKAFTLIELIIVILLISLVYFLVFSSFDLKKNQKKDLQIKDLKTYLLNNFSYENNLKFVCLDYESFPCYIFIDNALNEKVKIENLFMKEPRVYEYTKELKDFYLNEVKIENITYQTVFEIEFNKDYKHKDLVLEVENKVYLFNSISNIVKEYKSTNEILDEFYDKSIEVKDAL